MAAVSEDGETFFAGTNDMGKIIRITDANGDGVGDAPTVLFAAVPSGRLSSLRVVGNLVFTTGQGDGHPIVILELGATPADPLTLRGQITINYAGAFLHPHSALAVRLVPGETNKYELYFQLGSDTNFAVTTQTLSLTTDFGFTTTLAGDAIHRVIITDSQGALTGSDHVQIATGLRNPAGFDWHPVSGDLYFQDNGIDGVVNASEPTSADELNFIAKADLGGAIEDFGFPGDYIEYRTGNVIGGTKTQPLVAFTPIPSPATGAEAEGPSEIAFAPPKFPPGLNDGIFVGMHGQFSQGGTPNEENPLVYFDLTDSTYFHIIANTELGVGHLDGLLAAEDRLYVADISPQGGFGAGQVGTGVIYQIRCILTDLPLPRLLTVSDLASQNPFFDWDDVPGATSYTFEYADNSAFTNSDFRYDFPASKVDLGLNFLDGTYYWRVKASDGTKESAYSATASFVVTPALDQWMVVLLALGMMGYVIWRSRW